MGAVANMRPDLFAGIVAQVPFVDVLNTMLDKDLPLTPPEWPEWGNPIDQRRGFRHDPRLFAL
jgi:oligopeptidase B